MKRLNILSFIALFVLLSTWHISVTAAEMVSDVRVLIDVSGSMKKNDPKNLRVPALRLISGLLPDKSVSGTWIFGEHVNMVVPHGVVNEQWKQKAQQQSNKIHSLGLFTDIEQVIKKATQGVSKDDNYKRSIILLSDGLVDISKDKAYNSESRQRILDEVLPKLKELNIAVHTIALSENADHELLQAISLATDGWYEQVDDADALQRVFLHLFEKVAQRDTIPLTDKQFKIDDTVTEMTLLVFHSEGSKPTELLLPDKSKVSPEDLPPKTNWYSESNYDLITITSPMTGTWKIDAEMDPDNRVMVVTDLKLKTTDLPNNILMGESFEFDASLLNKDKIIHQQRFLKLVDAQLSEEVENNPPEELSLNSVQSKGVYSTRVGDTFQPGRNDIVITMKSATFERQRRQSINVIAVPFEISMDRVVDADTRSHRLVLSPDSQLINPKSLTITAILTAANGTEWSYDVMPNSEQQWQLTLADLEEEERYTVALQIKGETTKGRSVFLQPDPIELQEEFLESELGMDLSEDELKFGREQELDIEDEMNVEESILDEMAESDDETMLELDDEINGLGKDNIGKDEGLSSMAKLVIGNGILLLLLTAAIFIWRKKRTKQVNPGEQL